MRDNSAHLLELVDKGLSEGVGRQTVDEEVCRGVDDREETKDLIEGELGAGGRWWSLLWFCWQVGQCMQQSQDEGDRLGHCNCQGQCDNTDHDDAELSLHCRPSTADGLVDTTLEELIVGPEGEVDLDVGEE